MFKMGNGMVWRQWAPLPLRLVLGYGFVAHGWAKLSRGPAGCAKLLEQIGAPLPEATAWVSTLIEILGGLPNPAHAERVYGHSQRLRDNGKGALRYCSFG